MFITYKYSVEYLNKYYQEIYNNNFFKIVIVLVRRFILVF